MTTQAKPKRLPKLPDVWVVFNQNGVPIACEFLGSNATRMALASDRIVRYTPSKPRKVCRCGIEVCYGPYCHRCGGKVKS